MVWISTMLFPIKKGAFLHFHDGSIMSRGLSQRRTLLERASEGAHKVSLFELYVMTTSNPSTREQTAIADSQKSHSVILSAPTLIEES